VVQVGDAGSSAAEVRLAVGLLAALTGRTHAMRSLLASHSQHLKRTQTSALKPQNTGKSIIKHKSHQVHRFN